MTMALSFSPKKRRYLSIGRREADHFGAVMERTQLMGGMIESACYDQVAAPLDVNGQRPSFGWRLL